jgi:hypothetical protein
VASKKRTSCVAGGRQFLTREFYPGLIKMAHITIAVIPGRIISTIAYIGSKRGPYSYSGQTVFGIGTKSSGENSDLGFFQQIQLPGQFAVAAHHTGIRK